MSLVRVTEAASIASSAWVGSGNKLEADRAATNAMIDRLNQLPIDGSIRIGEGKKDQSYGLFKGDRVGLGSNPKELIGVHPYLDIAVDPIDGTTPTVNSGPEAMSVIAIAEQGAMFDTEEHYMLKLAVSGRVVKELVKQNVTLSLSTPIDILCCEVAQALGKPVDKLMVCILNRPRHDHYIKEMRNLGVRIKLIQDCDISGSIAAVEGSIDMQFGIGGAPESVLTAAAVKCLGGFFLSQVWKDGELIGDVMSHNDLVKSECCFAATGITDGSLLKGVSWISTGPQTHSVFMRSASGTIRFIETRHGN